MPLCPSIDASGIANNLNRKVFCGLKQNELRFSLSYRLKYHFSLPGLYPSDLDNRYRCFCGEQAQVIPAYTSYISDAFGESVPPILFYWGCERSTKRCGFCVPCSMAGVPYRYSDFPRKGHYEEQSGRRQDIHFGFCDKHNCAVGLFSITETRDISIRYGMCVERGKAETEMFWDVPSDYNLPFSLIVCPLAQRMECSHVFQILRRNYDDGS